MLATVQNTAGRSRAGEDRWSHAKPRLISRIQRRFSVSREALQVGDLRIEIARVADPDSLLDEVNDRSAWQPYWGEAWASSIAAARWLETQCHTGRQILDLGCGLGIAGSVAAARGAQVVMADVAQGALLFAQLNSWPWRTQVHVRRLDWRTDRLATRFDLVLGADVLYDRNEFPFLDDFCRWHLRQDARVVLVEPGRISGDDFIQWAQGHGWIVSVRPLPAVADRTKLRLIELQRATTAAPESDPNVPPATPDRAR